MAASPWRSLSQAVRAGESAGWVWSVSVTSKSSMTARALRPLGSEPPLLERGRG